MDVVVMLMFALCLGACHGAAGRSGGDATWSGLVVSAKVQLDPEIRPKLGELLAGERQTIRLEIKQLRLRDDPRIAYRIFLNEPNASDRTPIDRPSYLATVPGRPFSGEGKARNLVFDAFPVLKRLSERDLWTAAQPITMEVIAVPGTQRFAGSVELVRLVVPGSDQ